MARYIDIEGAGIGKANREQFLVPEFADGWNAVLKILEKEPTADVVEAKHGEWIQEWELEKGLEDNDEIPYIKCSLCGHTEWCIDKERDATPNYCSDCGAKMKNGS